MSKVFKEEIGRIRAQATTKRKHDFKIRAWLEGAPLPNGGKGTSLTFVLPTRGCKFAEAKHGGCSMCGYPNENPLDPPLQYLETLPEKTMEIFHSKKVKGPMVVKFFTSGSFLDKLEIPVHIREQLLQQFCEIEQIKEIIIESRTEYIIKKNLESITSITHPEKLTIAIGLETADDEINKRSINKGMTWKQFLRAVTLAKQYQVNLKAYVLLKPLFISELMAVKDAIQTAEKAIEVGVETISLNLSNIQKYTLMEHVFYQHGYRPPWLWSALFILKHLKNKYPKHRIMSDPIAAGTIRGPRNCGNCDREFQKQILKYSETQQLEHLETLDCSCKTVYESLLVHEAIGSGTGVLNNPLNF